MFVRKAHIFLIFVIMWRLLALALLVAAGPVAAQPLTLDQVRAKSHADLNPCCLFLTEQLLPCFCPPGRRRVA
jgi:hypothetical protein